MTGDQNAFILDQMVEGNPDNIPSLRTMSEQSSNNGRGISNISHQLSECCSSLRKLLEEILDRVKLGFENLTEKVNKIKPDIITELINFYKTEKDVFVKRASETFQELLNTIRKILEEELSSIKTTIDDIFQRLREFGEELTRKLTDLNNQIVDLNSNLNQLNSEVNHLNNNLEALTNKITSIEGELVILTEGLAGLVALIVPPLEKSLLLQTQTLGTAIGGVDANLNVWGLALNKNLSGQDNKIREVLIEKIEETEKTIIKEFEDLPSTIATEVSLNIVGESYLRWDSTCSYYPTISFIFIEETSRNVPRRSQIRLRAPKLGIEWTDQDVNNLKSKVLKNTNLTYNYGVCRGNYVSADKRLKTTVFGENEIEIENILTKTFSIIGENFNKELLTLTKGGGNVRL